MKGFPLVHPMLATPLDAPFHRGGWVYEEKYDGIRILASRRAGEVRLASRNLIDRTADFPEVMREIARLREGDLVLDGELVWFDPRGVSRFGLAGGDRSVLVVFDCLARDGVSLLGSPLTERRRALEEIVGKGSERLMPARRLEGGGLEAYRVAREKSWEGIVAKAESSLYLPGKRSREWLKVKIVQESEFAIGGFTAPAGSRAHLGALLLGLFDARGLRFVGKVGTGFTRETLARVRERLEPLRASESPFHDAPAYRNATWVRPRLVAQVRFAEWIGAGKLRHPVFLGLRADKPARACTWSARER
ncbi:hypothetical protein HY251_17385 [bacterium]|nr:hypothetical protein [bacterium]